jgi:hypothetical protein
VIDGVLGLEVVRVRCRPMLVERRPYFFVSHVASGVGPGQS